MSKAFAERFDALWGSIWVEPLQARNAFEKLLADAQDERDEDGVFLGLEGIRLASMRLGDPDRAADCLRLQAVLQPTSRNWFHVAAAAALEGNVDAAEAAGRSARDVAASEDEIREAEDLLTRIARRRDSTT